MARRRRKRRRFSDECQAAMYWARKRHVVLRAPVAGGPVNAELREDGGYELREDGGYELRE